MKRVNMNIFRLRQHQRNIAKRSDVTSGVSEVAAKVAWGFLFLQAMKMGEGRLFVLV